MTNTRTRSYTTATIALFAVLVTACGGAAGSASPGTTAVPTTAAPASVTPTTAVPTTAAPTSSVSGLPSATAGASLATSGRIEVADKGFAVTLPDGWTRIDLTSGDLEAILEAAGGFNEELAALQSEQLKQLVKGGLVVFAFGPDAQTNLNIMSLPSGGLSLDLLEQVNKAQVTQLSDGEVVADRIELPAGEAIHFRYAVQGQGDQRPSIEQFLLLVGDQQLVVSVTSGTTEDARTIAESIETLD